MPIAHKVCFIFSTHLQVGWKNLIVYCRSSWEIGTLFFCCLSLISTHLQVGEEKNQLFIACRWHFVLISTHLQAGQKTQLFITCRRVRVALSFYGACFWFQHICKMLTNMSILCCMPVALLFWFQQIYKLVKKMSIVYHMPVAFCFDFNKFASWPKKI